MISEFNICYAVSLLKIPNMTTLPGRWPRLHLFSQSNRIFSLFLNNALKGPAQGIRKPRQSVALLLNALFCNLPAVLIS